MADTESTISEHVHQSNPIAEIAYALKDYNIKSFEKNDTIIDMISSVLSSESGNEPFYVVDLGVVMSQFNKWTSLLPKIKPYYAIKCNPNTAIIKTLNILGTYFDCASKNEISQLLGMDIPASNIIFANPCKAEDHIKYARSMDVDLLTFDCKEELKKLSLYHEKASLVLRIKVDDTKSVCKFSCKFGADLSEVDELMNFAKYNELNIVGVSFHVGSNCKDVDTFYNAIKDARTVFDIGKKLGFDMTLLDIGGGFPGTDDTTIKFEDIAERITQAINDFFPEELYPKLDMIAEPGRFFSAASHTLVLNVIGKKKHFEKREDGSKETTFSYTLNDGVYGSFNCIMFDHAKPVIKPYNERDGEKHKSTVFGPTCDSIDTISKQTYLPDLAIGEKVFVEACGAYTTAAATTFNGFQPTKCVYVIRNPE